MYREHRVVVVTPAGRRRYLDLLVPQVLAFRGVVDEYRLWLNTTDADDLAFCERLAAEHADFVTVQRLPAGAAVDGNLSIHHFFKECADPGTVYVRLDDDVVLLDTLDAFEAMLDFRLDHPEFFLVYGCVLNNAVITHVQQRMMRFDTERGVCGYACMDPAGWSSPAFAEHVHRTVLRRLRDTTTTQDTTLPEREEQAGEAPVAGEAPLAPFRMPPWRLHFHNERVSINCISWLGSEFAAFGGAVGKDEELWLSVQKPLLVRKCNCIFGGFVCVHYAFYPQRPHLDATDILDAYRAVVLPPASPKRAH